MLALFVATKNYWRKAGIHMRGSFSIASSISCDDSYVSNVILENLKDRAITIFTIYLRVGHSYYIEIEDFSDRPLLLKPYESHHKEYGPIQFYGVNMNRIDLNPLFKSPSVPKRLVLSTSEGKYVVPSVIRQWSPIGDFFRNHMTAIIRPVQAMYKDKYIGGNVKYVIEFIGDNGQSEIVPIHPSDYQLKMFRKFSLTRESLESLTTLNDYLREQQLSGKLVCQSFTVLDMDSWRERANESYSDKRVHAEYIGFFNYHVFGRVATRLADRKLRIENAKRSARTGT
jgi:hypothetical protein